MPKNKVGFTVIETLIVLFISMMTLILLSFMGTNLKSNKSEESQFWQNFSKQWQLAGTQAIEEQILIDVSFNDTRVKFNYDDKAKNVTLDYPKGLKILTRPTIITIYENGYSSPKTIRWYSNNMGHYWNQRFQLGWGVYHLEREN